MRIRATEADLAVGTIVYRSERAKKAWTILAVYAPVDEHTVGLRYSLSGAGAGFSANNLWIEK